jgi:glycerol-3-phosphate acyltransferase PlsX
MQTIRIALDAMSGDHGHGVIVDAALAYVQDDPAVSLTLVGDRAALESAFKDRGRAPDERISVHHASEVVHMDELPSRALRLKKDSSMRVAINLVRDGLADAAVSAGNTGALMAISRFVLKMLPGIDRPAIVSALPGVSGHTHVLDLGANAACTAEHLLQFAVMGSVISNAVDGIENPRVALLNIGEEEIKGVEVIKRAATLLQAAPLNYVGFVEGDGIFFNQADVIVCDGFVGNVSLKTAEGVAKLIKQLMKDAFGQSWWAKLCGAAAWPVLRTLGPKIDPRHYNGASFLGLRGVVIKSHGSADAVAFANAIRVAVIEARKKVPARIGEKLAASLAILAEDAHIGELPVGQKIEDAI